jgi:hypothetical protein
MKVFLEYIWLDRNQPQQLRSKTKIDSSGYFEDRNPASNCDPNMVTYTMFSAIYNTVSINV